jgi:hypothetical protein
LKSETREKYARAWERYLEACAKGDVSPVPVNTTALLNFIGSEYARGSASSSLDLYLTGIKHTAHQQGIPIDVDDFLLRQCRKGFRNSSSSPGVLDPLRLEVLLRFRPLLLGQDILQLGPFDRHMVWTSFLFAFFGLLRVSEYTGALKRCHVISEGEGLRVSLVSTKNSPNAMTFAYMALSSNSEVCPVRAFRAFVEQRDRIFPQDSLLFVFGNGIEYQPRDVNRFISTLASSSGVSPPLRLSSHSLRIGGASEAARAGVNAKIIQSMGRWRSDCFMRYIHPEVCDILNAQRLMSSKLCSS